jgi:pyridoxal phosphate enzyme (YggS family)
MTMVPSQILAFHRVIDEIKNTLTNSSFPTLVIVAKNRQVTEIEPLLQIGHRHFAENYVQEAAEKWPQLRQLYPDIRLHMIGHLQRNKVKQALQLFDVIQTIDNEKLAETMAVAWSGGQQTTELFIQVACSADQHKTGIAVTEFHTLLQYMCSQALPVRGVMGVAPTHGSPLSAFKLLKVLQEESRLPALSMGMSRDYKEAIGMGATHVRLGEAIFGKRQ